MTLPCFKCGRELKSAVWADKNDPRAQESNQPYSGTAFQTCGHYGSTFIDNLSPADKWLEINLCDECLREAERDRPATLRYFEPDIAP